jgi:inosine-uridine nucleoside N-ribohydrolase
VRRVGPQGLPVYAGATRAEDLGVETAASHALAEALRKERLTILSLGPVTNIATVLKNHPDLSGAIVEIIAVAGRRPGQRFLATPEQKIPFRDFNFELDAPGFQVLLDSSAPLTLAPWEISSKVWLKEAELKRLAEGNEATRWLHQPAADWLEKWRRDLRLDGFNPFDTLAICYLTSPQLTRWEELQAEIRVLPDDVKQAEQPGGEAEEKPYLLLGGESKVKRKVRYCFDVAPEFKEDLMARLLR